MFDLAGASSFLGVGRDNLTGPKDAEVTTSLLYKFNVDGAADSETDEEGHERLPRAAANNGLATSQRSFSPVCPGSTATERPIRARNHRLPTPLWMRLTSAPSSLLNFSSRNGSRRRYADEEAVFPESPFQEDREEQRRRGKHHRRDCGRRCGWFLFWALIMFGVLHVVFLTCGAFVAFFPDSTDRLFHDLSHPDHAHDVDFADRYLTDVASLPRPLCHSHNDYWRRRPLYSALEAGCTSVEADVWLFDDDLYVGHMSAELTKDRTLRSLYVDPIIKILEARNGVYTTRSSGPKSLSGVFQSAPEQTLVLLIDFKTNGEDLMPAVFSQLEPLRTRGFLTYYNGSDIIPGPVTVVATGNAPFHLIVESDTYRDIFFDAPLNIMDQEASDSPSDDERVEPAGRKSDQDHGQGYSDFGGIRPRPTTFTVENSYYASVSFYRAVGLTWYWMWPPSWFGTDSPSWSSRSANPGNNVLSPKQVEILRAQIAGAHRQGLKVRYWDTPVWPQWVRARVYKTLVEEGADYLNIDDLRGGAAGGSDWWWW